MSKSYTIKVNESYEFSLDVESIKGLDINKKSENRYHVIHENKAYTVKNIVSDFSNKKYKICVNGNKFNVVIKDNIDRLIKELGLTVNGKQKDLNIKAPMPGLILDIIVHEGQEVKEGDALLVLEAMKMENILLAPKDGVIKSIEIIKGEAVEKKQLLIEME